MLMQLFELAEAIIALHNVVENHDFLDRERWYALLTEVAKKRQFKH